MQPKKKKNRSPASIKQRLLATQEWRKKNPAHVKDSFRRWRNGNPERNKARARVQQLKKYGLTLADYDAMLAAQGHCCAICKVDKPGWLKRVNWCVDHCHTTGKVRGLLCCSCNAAIGHAKDSPSILRQAAAYLDSARQEAPAPGWTAPILKAA